MLNATQINNANVLKSEMTKAGITNPFMQTAILAIAYKERGFNPSAKETSYATTPNERIRSIFSKARPLTEAQLNSLKADNVAFFNYVYNGIIGNGSTDGYKFRGRGFNQLTGRANYDAYGKRIGIDLVGNPDLVSTPDVASKVLISFMKTGIESLKRVGKFFGKDINDVPDQKTAYNAVYNINAGAGKNLYDAQGNIKSDTTGGYNKGLDSLAYLSDTIVKAKTAIKDATIKGIQEVKKKPLTTIVLTTLLIVSGYLVYKYGFKNKIK